MSSLFVCVFLLIVVIGLPHCSPSRIQPTFESSDRLLLPTLLLRPTVDSRDVEMSEILSLANRLDKTVGGPSILGRVVTTAKTLKNANSLLLASVVPESYAVSSSSKPARLADRNLCSLLHALIVNPSPPPTRVIKVKDGPLKATLEVHNVTNTSQALRINSLIAGYLSGYSTSSPPNPRLTIVRLRTSLPALSYLQSPPPSVASLQSSISSLPGPILLIASGISGTISQRLSLPPTSLCVTCDSPPHSAPPSPRLRAPRGDNLLQLSADRSKVITDHNLRVLRSALNGKSVKKREEVAR